jgi:hypothetical protein
VARVVERMPSKCEAMSSNPPVPQKKGRKKKKIKIDTFHLPHIVYFISQCTTIYNSFSKGTRLLTILGLGLWIAVFWVL